MQGEAAGRDILFCRESALGWHGRSASAVAYSLAVTCQTLRAGENSAETAVGAPQRAGAVGGIDDEGRQFGPVGHGKGGVGAAAAATRPESAV